MKDNLSKVWDQKQPKVVAPAPPASSAAQSSVAVSNDTYEGHLFLSDPEISDSGDLS